jgi:hypothetical protein
MQETTVDRLGEWFTIDGAAREYQTTYNAVKGYLRRKHVPVLKLGGKCTVVRLTDLDGLRPAKR